MYREADAPKIGGESMIPLSAFAEVHARQLSAFVAESMVNKLVEI
jgi:hypothetical protein